MRKFTGTAMVIAAVSIFAAPQVQASPCVGVLNQSGCQPVPWNGQLMNTWDIPGSYGGWVNTPVACDPITNRCRMWAQP